MDLELNLVITIGAKKRASGSGFGRPTSKVIRGNSTWYQPTQNLMKGVTRVIPGETKGLRPYPLDQGMELCFPPRQKHDLACRT